jgi:hypothetical protein
VLFFGKRSTRNGFIGVTAFLVPVGILFRPSTMTTSRRCWSGPTAYGWRTTSCGPSDCGGSIRKTSLPSAAICKSQISAHVATGCTLKWASHPDARAIELLRAIA